MSTRSRTVRAVDSITDERVPLRTLQFKHSTDSGRYHNVQLPMRVC